MEYLFIKKIKEILLTFCMITTGIVFATLIYIKVFYGMNDVGAEILGQILITSFLCSLGNLIHSAKEVGIWRYRIDILLHYLYINVVVLGLGDYFEWFDLSVPVMTLGMMVLIIIIFIIISFVLWAMETRETRRLNEKLLEYQRGKTVIKGTDTAEGTEMEKQDR